MKIKTKIGESLDLDDEKVTRKINEELDNLKMDLVKTDHQKFAETIEVKDLPKLPDDIFKENEDDEEQKSTKKRKDNELEGHLDENVIE